MKIVNIMNFIRRGKEKSEALQKIMLETTKAEFELAKSYGYDNTFLIEYDALIAPEYIEFFKSNMDERTELGLWYEIVRPLTDKVGLEWRGDKDRDWDWHIVPGFSMAYSQKERELLADEAMNCFKDIYGYYPKTVASWLIDTYTINYLSEKYDISAFAICRDQTNTDAYTLIGGYFNQAYYPSKRNMFTPAQTDELRGNTPVFRLLGPDPIHNYDKNKYFKNPRFKDYILPPTLEPIWDYGNDAEVISYLFNTYYKNESLQFAYSQLGQENGFGTYGEGAKKITDGLKRQFEEIKKYPDVKIMKMSDAGELFKKTFEDTPATSVCALSEFDGDENIQSVYYDCKNYTANIFRFDNKIFIRSLYLFDENMYDSYFETPCETWDALYENLPVVDTLIWEENAGLVLDNEATAFEVSKQSETELKVSWKDKYVLFSQDKISFNNIDAVLDTTGSKAEIKIDKNNIMYTYKGHSYDIKTENCDIKEEGEKIYLTSNGISTLHLKTN